MTSGRNNVECPQYFGNGDEEAVFCQMHPGADTPSCTEGPMIAMRIRGCSVDSRFVWVTQISFRFELFRIGEEVGVIVDRVLLDRHNASFRYHVSFIICIRRGVVGSAHVCYGS